MVIPLVYHAGDPGSIPAGGVGGVGGGGIISFSISFVFFKFLIL